MRFLSLSRRGIFNNMSDEKYLSILWKLRMGYDLDLNNPVTFNEKLQWLKINDRKPIYSTMVDKYEAKKYVANIIGEEYIIPTLGVWDSFDEIDFDKLPNQFVLKCTHDSGGLVICKDKAALDLKAARKKLNKCMKHNYYYASREWPYKDVKPRIIAEKYMADESGIELKDYKIHNFDGIPQFIEVDYGRFSEHKRNLYSTDWEYIEAAIKYPTDKNVKINRPENLEKMIVLARKLSEKIPYVRTDFYSIFGKIYFGEITFYHDSGMGEFTPKEWDAKLGEWIILDDLKTIKEI